ncbi:MAG: GTPase ObgE [Verrucomicrobiota bacterium]|nr:GTPase ObgE [Verrucomicrobiota bacterium]MEC8517742.1 GTPase ObgE [Verrucomicrobiota bacterium]MEC8753902.1 GTPase ObgE [Verrucomicrobiota bacterium]
MKTVIFRDRVKLYAKAGNGGPGCVSFRREKFIPKGGPDGGDGGHGGSVILRCDIEEDSLLPIFYEPHRKAKNAQHGMGSNCHGKNSEDCVIKVAPGTVVLDADTEEFIGELINHDEELIIAKGGHGGIGNARFKSSTNRAPRQFTEGTEGEEKTVWLELKLISDVGLVGYPNAGKSTLLSKLTNASPKIASYPFTTINPIIGTLEYDDFNRVKIADIPGLIDGANEGIGLGHHFLRHIERAKFFVFVIDIAGTDERNPVEDFINLKKELRLHLQSLANTPYIIAANKIDSPYADDNLKIFKEMIDEHVFEISAELDIGLDAIKTHLYNNFFKTK